MSEDSHAVHFGCSCASETHFSMNAVHSLFSIEAASLKVCCNLNITQVDERNKWKNVSLLLHFNRCTFKVDAEYNEATFLSVYTIKRLRLIHSL